MTDEGDRPKNKLRRSIYIQVEPTAWPKEGLSVLNRLTIAIIVFALILAILETEPTIGVTYSRIFNLVEGVLIALLIMEYCLRFWAAAEHKPHGGGWRSRARFFFSPSGMLDLVVIVTSLLPFFGGNTIVLRLVGVVLILRLASLGGFSRALGDLFEAVTSRKYELLISLSLSLLLMVFGATAMWWVEGETQPEHFGSIPRALWWAIVTLTTIGYGDAYPITPLGKLLAGFVAVAGIGLIALPSGVLAAAFSEISRRR